MTNFMEFPTKAITCQNGALSTTSLKVAEAFGKLHKDILRKLESLDCSIEFTERNFTPSEYKDTSGRKLSMWNMTKDGFMFLVMGFTGKKAAAIKEAYIMEFNRMAEELEAAKPEIDARKQLGFAVQILAAHRGMRTQAVASSVASHFGLSDVDQLNPAQLAIALEYIQQAVLSQSDPQRIATSSQGIIEYNQGSRVSSGYQLTRAGQIARLIVQNTLEISKCRNQNPLDVCIQTFQKLTERREELVKEYQLACEEQQAIRNWYC